METDQGWVLGDPSDDATKGLWIRAEPVGTRNQLNDLVQTNADHSQSGRLCLVTGNAPSNAFFTEQAVQDGKTTVTSPTFSAIVSGEPVIEYYRWHTDAQLNNPWHAQISNDNGATWVDVENTGHPQAFWRRVLFPVRAFVTPTSTMKMRFVVSALKQVTDVVEGALDDFRLLTLPVGSVAAQPASASGVHATVERLRARSSLPFASEVTLEYGLGAAGPVSLRIFDLGGRLVRNLARGDQPAGLHTIHWDGRDESGQAVRDGVYFGRLEAAGRHDVLRLVRMK